MSTKCVSLRFDEIALGDNYLVQTSEYWYLVKKDELPKFYSILQQFRIKFKEDTGSRNFLLTSVEEHDLEIKEAKLIAKGVERVGGKSFLDQPPVDCKYLQELLDDYQETCRYLQTLPLQEKV